MKQLALPVPQPEAEQPGPELVTTPAAIHPHEPEQLPLIRMLAVVTQKIDSLQSGQRSLSADLRDIKASLPVQRKPLSVRSQELHVHVIWTRRNGLCPCCQESPVCGAAGRIEGSEYDHWFCRSKNRVTQTWLICGECNGKLRDTDFKAEMRSAFESYQQALRPFLGRQIPMVLFEAAGK